MTPRSEPEVWNFRKYKDDGPADDADNESRVSVEATVSQDDQVKIGYLFPKDRVRFRGTDLWTTLLGDLLAALRKADPSSVCVVFDTLSSPGDTMKAAIDLSTIAGALQPALGCYFVGIETEPRLYNILEDRRNKTLERLVELNITVASTTKV